MPELPDGWCWAKWEQIGECQNGRAFPSKHYSDKGVKLLRPGNLHMSGDVRWNEKNTRFMPEEWEREHPSYIVGANELVMNLTAQSLKDEFLGRVCLTPDGEHCLLNQRIAKLTPHESISPEFCLLLLKSPQFRQYVDTLNTGSLIQHMFTTQMNHFVFAFPPLAEQESIVAVAKEGLSIEESLLEHIASLESSLTQLDQSILAKAFRGELVPQDPRDEPASELLARIRTTRQQAEAASKAAKKKSKKKTTRKRKASSEVQGG